MKFNFVQVRALLIMVKCVMYCWREPHDNAVKSPDINIAVATCAKGPFQYGFINLNDVCYNTLM